MTRRLRMPRTRTLLFAAVIALQLGVSLVSFFQWQTMREATQSVQHAMSVQTKIEAVLRNLFLTESMQRGYVITGDESYLASYSESARNLGANLYELRDLIGSDSEQRQLLQSVTMLHQDRLRQLDQTISLRQAGGLQDAASQIASGEGQKLSADLVALLSQMDNAEKRVMLERRDHEYDNSRFFLWLSCFGGVLASGSVWAAALVINREFRNRQKAEAALRQSEERLRFALDAGRIGAWTWDISNNHVELDDRARGNLGLRSHPFHGTYQEIIDLIPEPERTKMEAQIGRALLEGSSATFSHPVIWPDGSVHSLVSQCDIHRDERGTAVLMVGISTDVTELRITEENLKRAHGELETAARRLEGIINASTDQIAALDMNYRWIAFNSAYIEEFEALFGRRPVVGTSLVDALVHLPDEQAKYVRHWGRALAGETFTVTEDFGDEGNVRRAFEMTFNPLFDAASRRIGATHVIRDVTERRRAEDELEKARRQAERVSAAKSAFLAQVSHELRTPLGAIMGYADLLLSEEESPEEQQHFTQNIQRNTRQLLELINDLLDLSRVEEGRIEIDRVAFSLSDILQQVHDMLAPRAEARGVALTVHVDSLVPDALVADATRLRQILVNLAGNAVKFTERGRIDIDVAVRPGQESSSLQLVIQVADTGIGMTPEQQKRIFSAFGQADATVSRRFGGSGLGLALSRRLAEAMEGSLELARSAPGVGSVFTLALPVGVASELKDTSALDSWAQQSRPIQEPIPQEEWEGSAQGVQGEPDSTMGEQRPAVMKDTALPFGKELDGCRILLVEDSPDNQFLFRHMLATANATVDSADDGPKGLEKVTKQTYDAVLLDLEMPEMSGWEVIKAMRQSGMRLPVIALTAHAIKGVRERCLEAGFNDYLSKPVDRDRLVMTVAKMLKGGGMGGPANARRPLVEGLVQGP